MLSVFQDIFLDFFLNRNSSVCWCVDLSVGFLFDFIYQQVYFLCQDHAGFIALVCSVAQFELEMVITPSFSLISIKQRTSHADVDVRKDNTHLFLMGVQTFTDSVEVSVVVPQKM